MYHVFACKSFDVSSANKQTKKNKISKEEVIKRQLEADKRFNRVSIITFVSILLFLFSFLYIQQYWCELRFKYRMHFMYGKILPPDWVCMNGNELEPHITNRITLNELPYFVCSDGCYDWFSNNYQSCGFAKDTITGKLINKAKAVIGLQSKNKPEVVYFETKASFLKYYSQHEK